MIEFLNNVLVLLYVLSILNCVRHIFFFIQTYYAEESKKYILNKYSILFLGLSISYIVTGIINGIKILV